MGGTTTVPMLSTDRGLTQYLTEIRKFPMLRPDQEVAYATRWREHGDREAAYHLVTSHLRLVAKIAMRYRGYPLTVAPMTRKLRKAGIELSPRAPGGRRFG